MVHLMGQELCFVKRSPWIGQGFVEREPSLTGCCPYSNGCAVRGFCACTNIKKFVCPRMPFVYILQHFVFLTSGMSIFVVWYVSGGCAIFGWISGLCALRKQFGQVFVFCASCSCLAQQSLAVALWICSFRARKRKTNKKKNKKQKTKNKKTKKAKNKKKNKNQKPKTKNQKTKNKKQRKRKKGEETKSEQRQKPKETLR